MSCASPANSSKRNTCKTNPFLAKMLLLLVAPAQNLHASQLNEPPFHGPTAPAPALSLAFSVAPCAWDTLLLIPGPAPQWSASFLL